MPHFFPPLRFLILFLCAAMLSISPSFSAEPTWTQLHGVKHTVLAADASKGRIAIFDDTGKMTWEYKIANLHDLQMLENGNILFQTDWAQLVEVAPEGMSGGKIVWSYDAAKMNGNAGKSVQVHTFQRLSDGVTMIAESGPARIIEVDSSGKIVHEIKLKVDHPDPHRDTRLARKLASGNYLVCHEGDGRVREYDPAGKIVWEFAIPGEGGKFDHKGSGTAVFGALRLPNGNTLVATGNGHSVLEVNKSGEIVWNVTSKDLPGIELAWVTTLEVLPNGNRVIGNCHAGPDNPQIIEVTPDKKLVWAFRDFNLLGDALSNSQLIEANGTKWKPVNRR